MGTTTWVSNEWRHQDRGTDRVCGMGEEKGLGRCLGFVWTTRRGRGANQMNRTTKRVTTLLRVDIHWGPCPRKPSSLLLLGGLSGQGCRNTCLLPRRETLVQSAGRVGSEAPPDSSEAVLPGRRPVSRSLLPSAPAWIAVSCYRAGTKEALASWLPSRQTPWSLLCRVPSPE